MWRIPLSKSQSDRKNEALKWPEYLNFVWLFQMSQKRLQFASYFSTKRKDEKLVWEVKKKSQSNNSKRRHECLSLEITLCLLFIQQRRQLKGEQQRQQQQSPLSTAPLKEKVPKEFILCEMLQKVMIYCLFWVGIKISRQVQLFEGDVILVRRYYAIFHFILFIYSFVFKSTDSFVNLLLHAFH